MTNEPPQALPLTPAEEEMRVILRTLLGRLLEAQESRYFPLYVGPVRRAEPVRRALEAAAASAGVTVLGPEALCDGSSGPGVGLAPLRAARQVLADRSDRRWVIVGDVDPERLPDEVLRRLDSDGLLFDTRQTPAPPARVSPLSLAFREREGREGPWAIRVAAEPDSASLVAAEAAMRLRLRGHAVGPVWNPGHDVVAAGAPIPSGGRPALVVQLDAAVPAERLDDLESLTRHRGAVLVMVGPQRFLGARGHDFVRTSPTPVPDVVRSATWPPAREMLTGAPETGTVRELISVVDGGRTLNQVVRAAASWERRGFVLLYTPDRFGWISVDGGEGLVCGAMCAGESRGSDAAHVLACIRAMSAWHGARALFVAATEPHPVGAWACSVLVDTVDLDVRRTRDEVRGGGPVPEVGAEHRAGIRPSCIARELLWWGQTRFACELLESAERASSWGVEEELLLGYLSAERDPREAAARLQHAAHRISVELATGTWGQHVDATLAALVLDVRTHPGRAPQAWAVIERWLESEGHGWVATERHAAVLYEIAARAGELGRAVYFRDLLLRLSPPDRPLLAWVRRSDPLPLVRSPE